MADDFDPFEAFDDDGDNGTSSKPNSMEALEIERQIKARQDAESLLLKMSSSVGSTKRPSEAIAPSSSKDAPPLEKQLRTNGDSSNAAVNEIMHHEVFDEVMEVNEDDEIQGLNMNSTARITTYKIEAEGCMHEVAYPVGMEYTPLVWRQTEPAKKYPFKLDPFQKEAINCIDNNQSVLVSAHTSAGKTVNALYAIAMALRDNQRVIYTSPIKALSNQKFRELSDEFHDVGLMTGDVTLNPDASCIVMTTEILRSMLYRGSEIMREVGWVIFDEIHYMRDKERGVVWEETIILLPDNVHYVFLSATIPNARQFAEWVCFLHKQPCHVVYTDYRPVPLMHFIYPAGGEGLYEVVNIQGQFNEDKFKAAMLGLQEAGDGLDSRDRRGGRGNQQKNDSNVIKLVRTIKERDMLPCIVFSFSRRECEAYASCLKDMDFNTDDEKKMVKTIFTSAINLLSDEDRQIDQIKLVEPYLLRGIGVHHSGLLPIIKEVIEILFGESLIKVLFATETFSMGLNMPAKTVLFTSARKFDGKDYRWITSGEYIQMSGRSGRRGKDDKGLVIMMLDQAMSSDVAKQIIKGQADALNSQFRLTYNMVLNLLRVEGINPEFMLEKSFYQFQNFSTLPDLHNKCINKKHEYDSLRIAHEAELQGYFEMEKRIDELRESIHKTQFLPKYVAPYLIAGRMFHIKANGYDFGWCFLLNFHKKVDPLSETNEMIYVLDVAVHISSESAKHFASNPNVNVIRPPAKGERGVMEVCSFLLTSIHDISQIRLKLPNDLQGKEKLASLSHMHEKAMERFNGQPPIMDPIKDMKIPDEDFKKKLETLKQLEQRKASHPLRKRQNFEELCAEYQRKMDLHSEYKEAKEAFKKAKSLLQLDELGCRKRVLRRLQYCDDADVITHKGRVACEVSAADELLLTEMIFSGVFNTLTSEQCASLLSCFVFEEKANVAKLPDELSGCLKTMQSFARKIAKATNEAKMPLDEETYVESFRPHLMDVVYQWCSGASFRQILQTTEIFEGSIIRALRRLEELLREMIGAAKSIGNTELEQKFETARNQLKRDIVFAASLYL